MVKHIKRITSQSLDQGSELLKIDKLNKCAVKLPIIKTSSANMEKNIHCSALIQHKPRNTTKNTILSEVSEPKKCFVRLHKIKNLGVQGDIRPNEIPKHGTKLYDRGEESKDAKENIFKRYNVHMDSGNITVTRADPLNSNYKNVSNREKMGNIPSGSIRRSKRALVLKERNCNKTQDVYDFDSESFTAEGESLTQEVIKKLISEGKAIIVKYKHEPPKKKVRKKSTSEVLKRLKRSLLKNQSELVDSLRKKKGIEVNGCSTKSIIDDSFCAPELIDFDGERIEKNCDNEKDSFTLNNTVNEPQDDTDTNLANVSENLTENNNLNVSTNSAYTKGKTSFALLNPAKAVKVLEVLYLPNRAAVLPSSTPMKNNSQINNISNGNSINAFKNVRDDKGLDITHANCFDFLAMLDGENAKSHSSQKDRELGARTIVVENERDNLLERDIDKESSDTDNAETENDSIFADVNVRDNFDATTLKKVRDDKGLDITHANCFDFLAMIDGEKSTSNKGPSQGDRELEDLTNACENLRHNLPERDADEESSDTEVDETTNNSIFPDVNIRTHFDTTVPRKSYGRTPKSPKQRPHFFILFSDDKKESKKERESVCISSKKDGASDNKLAKSSQKEVKRSTRKVKGNEREAVKEKENKVPSSREILRNKRKTDRGVQLNVDEENSQSRKRMKLNVGSKETPYLKNVVAERNLKLKGRKLRL